MNSPTAQKQLVNERGRIPLFLQIQLAVVSIVRDFIPLRTALSKMRDMLPQLQCIIIPRHSSIMVDHHYRLNIHGVENHLHSFDRPLTQDRTSDTTWGNLLASGNYEGC